MAKKKSVARPRARSCGNALKAWAVTFNLRFAGGQNVSNIAHVSPGRFKVWFQKPMKGNQYAIIATAAPQGVVNYNDFGADSFVLTISDLKGSPLDADISVAIYEA